MDPVQSVGPVSETLRNAEPPEVIHVQGKTEVNPAVAVTQLLQSAQTTGASPQDVLSELDAILTSAQQSVLDEWFHTPASVYSASGGVTSTTDAAPDIISTEV